MKLIKFNACVSWDTQLPELAPFSRCHVIYIFLKSEQLNWTDLEWEQSLHKKYNKVSKWINKKSKQIEKRIPYTLLNICTRLKQR